MILTINAGSSSLKFALFERTGDEPTLHGVVEKLGSEQPVLHVHMTDQPSLELSLEGSAGADHHAALGTVFEGLRQKFPELCLQAIGHRVVHGGPDIDAPQPVNENLLSKLKEYAPFVPLHQPHNLAGIEAAIAHFPDALQIACFDTAFHRGRPWVHDTYGLPARYYEAGVRRYGFHGLSYEYITDTLQQNYLQQYAGKVIIAHLGSGASMSAVDCGQPIICTMGFSGLDGLPMGTRSGSIDPQILLYLMEYEHRSVEELTTLLYHESGLRGLSGISNDVRELDKSTKPQARQALDYMVARIRYELGGLTASLGGLDTLVFTGGIGERHAWTREQVCDKMEWLGIKIDSKSNADDNVLISDDCSKVKVMVIPTNEELVIARSARTILKQFE